MHVLANNLIVIKLFGKNNSMKFDKNNNLFIRHINIY